MMLRSESSEEKFLTLYDIGRIEKDAKERRGNIVMAAYALIAGGGERFPITLANLLKTQGYAVTFLNCNHDATDPRVRMKLRKDIPLLQLETFSAIPRVFHDFGVEVVHSHHASVDVLLSTLLANSPEINQVVT